MTPPTHTHKNSTDTVFKPPTNEINPPTKLIFYNPIDIVVEPDVGPSHVQKECVVEPFINVYVPSEELNNENPQIEEVANEDNEKDEMMS